MVFVPVRSRGGEAGKVRSDDDSRREAGNQRLLDRPHIALVHYMLLLRGAELMFSGDRGRVARRV